MIPETRVDGSDLMQSDVHHFEIKTDGKSLWAIRAIDTNGLEGEWSDWVESNKSQCLIKDYSSLDKVGRIESHSVIRYLINLHDFPYRLTH